MMMEMMMDVEKRMQKKDAEGKKPRKVLHFAVWVSGPEEDGRAEWGRGQQRRWRLKLT